MNPARATSGPAAIGRKSLDVITESIGWDPWAGGVFVAAWICSRLLWRA